MRRAVWVLAAIAAARLAFAFTFELVPQEAYYFFYAQHLALSYFDHPPVLAYLLRLSSELLGHSELSIRLTSFSVSCLLQLSFWLLARRFVPGERLGRALLLFGTTGLVTIVTLISTPDVPLLLFWTLALLHLYRASFEGRAWSWLWAGLFMGLAFDSKYTALALQGGLVLFLAASPAHRPLLRSWRPWGALALAHAVAAPVYLWNAQHGWASFLFQTSERASAGASLGVRFFLALVGTQAALLLPPLLFALVRDAVRAARACVPVAPSPESARTAFLLCFFLPVAGLFTAVSFFSLVKPNWLMPSYIAGVLLVARAASRKLAAWNYGASALAHLLAAVQLLFYPVPIQSDDTWFGWKELARKVDSEQKAHPGAFLFSADGYKTTAELSFYLDEKVYGRNVLGERALEYDYVGDDLGALRGRDALFVDSAPRDFTREESGHVPEALGPHFASVEVLPPILIERRGRVVRKFHVYLCHGYRGTGASPPPAQVQEGSR